MKRELPKRVEEVLGARVAFARFQIAEVTTINANEEPETFPVYTSYNKERAKIVFDTSIAYTRKIMNIQGNPRVAVLFSNMAVAALRSFPTVLVQGIADTYDPNPLVLSHLHLQTEERRRKFDWYMIRVRVEVDIQRIYIWKNQDLNEKPEIIEVESYDR